MTNYNAMKKFKKVAKLWAESEKKPHDFGDGQVVYHSEVFMLMHINKHKNSSVTELAKILDMTKGSVSEVLKKLEKKGFIIKNIAPDNASKILIDISNKGLEILDKHEKIHENAESGFKKYYETLDEDKLSFLEDFFSEYEKFLIEINEKELTDLIKNKKSSRKAK